LAGLAGIATWLGLSPPWAKDPDVDSGSETEPRAPSEPGRTVGPPKPKAGYTRGLAGRWQGRVVTTAVTAPLRATIHLRHPSSTVNAGAHQTVELEDPQNHVREGAERCVGRLRLIGVRGPALTYRVVNDFSRSSGTCEDGPRLTVTYVSDLEARYSLQLSVWDPYVGALGHAR
jgi:hypothetical protein